MFAVLLSHPLAAQSVRGSALDEGGRGVAGVVVMLVDNTAKVIARTLTDERGSYSLAAPRAGTYRARTMRVGFRPTESKPFIVASGPIAFNIALSGIRVALDTVRVVDRGVCRNPTDSAAAIFRVWEQVRTALTATELAMMGRGLQATTITYDRVLDRDFAHVSAENAVMQSGYVKQAWRAVPPAILHDSGYMTRSADGWMKYEAPGLDMLTSAIFTEDHCFHLAAGRDVPGRGVASSQIGIAFEPTASRKKVVDIRGLLVLDSKTAELRTMSFTYTNVPREQGDLAGGTMEFARQRDGTWIIARWLIRMPVVAEGADGQPRVDEVRENGGQLTAISRGSDTLWVRPSLTVAGTVVDSASGRALDGATIALRGTTRRAVSEAGKFVLSDVLPGEYFVDVRTAGLDSIGAVSETPITISDSLTPVYVRVPTATQMLGSVCGAGRRSPSDGPGVVLGFVRQRGDSLPPPSARVRAEWYSISLTDRKGAPIERERHSLEATPTSRGVFRFCGLPLETDIAIDAAADGLLATPQMVRLSDKRFVTTNLVLDSRAAARARLTGLVTDSARSPVAGAQISIPSLARGAVTGPDGSFTLDSLPLGPVQVIVRRLPFAEADIQIDLAKPGTVHQDVVLSRVVNLAPSVRTERALPQSFSDNMTVGLGHFLTRAQLEAQEGRQLSSVMADILGVGLTYGSSGEAWVRGSHGRAKVYGPTKVEKAHGMIEACYAQVYVNGTWENRGDPTPPFDLNTLVPGQIEAIEFYAGAGQTPLIYSSLNSGCGVVVIWLRR
jgi:hypothetical protein